MPNFEQKNVVMRIEVHLIKFRSVLIYFKKFT